MIEPLQGKREVGATFVVRDRVDFIDDYGFDGSEDFTAVRSGEEDVQRLGGRHQNVGRARQHGAAFVGQRVSRTNGGAYIWHEDAALAGKLHNFAERNFEIFLNVVAERFERRYVENF